MNDRATNAASIWRALAVDREIAIDFIGIFSRFEYALKRAGFLQEGGAAKPSWRTFEERLVKEASDANLKTVYAAGAYLFAHPARKQIVRHGALDWDDPTAAPEPPSLPWLLEVVRTTRNNLFHGGKFMAGPIPDPLRDGQLLSASSDVLLALLDVDAPAAREVKDLFWRFPPD